MTIKHHPPEDILAAFAAGALDEGQHLVVAVHVSRCPSCRRFVSAVEELGGTTLEATDPVAMADDALDAVMGRLDHPSRPATAAHADSPAEEFELPDIVKGYRIGRRRRIAPGVSLRPIELPRPSQSRVFLLRSGPGTRMLEHTHTGTELTCVLSGSFSHEAGRFGPGDFDYGDETLDHLPVVGTEGPCLCLVAMTGDLRMHGLLGRLIGPFVRL